MGISLSGAEFKQIKFKKSAKIAWFWVRATKIHLLLSWLQPKFICFHFRPKSNKFWFSIWNLSIYQEKSFKGLQFPQASVSNVLWVDFSYFWVLGHILLIWIVKLKSHLNLTVLKISRKNCECGGFRQRVWKKRWMAILVENCMTDIFLWIRNAKYR